MRSYEAPAKVNLSLHVQPPEEGYHPLVSLVQTIEWCDRLDVSASEEWSLSIDVADLGVEDNLVARAFEKLGLERAAVSLAKRIPVAAGLGGGSSNAAAGLIAAADLAGIARSNVEELAVELGSDVPLFIRGGTQLMEGRGEKLESLRALRGFAVAVVVPDLHLATADVYQKWDRMEGPRGEVVDDRHLPPMLRGGMPLRNDLVPAALELAPALGDFMADVRAAWAMPILMSGSGPACFGLFASEQEAIDAAGAVASVRAGVGARLRDHGVAEIPVSAGDQAAVG